jgi:asparaginyl-tRNA synthetase
MKTSTINQILSGPISNQEIVIQGWVRFFRNDQFVIVNDGSTIKTIQLVLNASDYETEFLNKINVGAAVRAKGELVESSGRGQACELKVTSFEILGESNPDEFPIQPKKHSLEFLREKSHLRVRTNTFAAIFRIRHAMTFAVHQFFNDREFFNIHTPIITASDCEGAGEMFRVSTFEPNKAPLNEEGNIDWEKDFFGKEASLTVSGQLNGELAAMALGKIYTFGPTFRAENSNTSRHLAEFWMIEPEVAFHDLKDNIDLAEEFMKYCVQYALDKCKDDLDFLDNRLADVEKLLPQNKRQEMTLIEKLKFVTENNFARVTYTEAFDILKNSKPNKKGKFEYPVKDWGIDLQSEHEKFLVEKHFKKPVVVTDYPAGIKAFYMKLNEDGKTVAAMDVLVPGIGEIIGGSQREEDLEKLKSATAKFDIPEEDIWWYLETRQFGTAVHSGFGLGFERLLLFVTGMGNIRDVIPFPRAPKLADF